MFRWLMLFLISAWLVSCARSQIKEPEQAMRKSSKNIDFVDEQPFEPLIDGLKQSVDQLRAIKSPQDQLIFGSQMISVEDYTAAIDYLSRQYEAGGKDQFIEVLKRNFEILEVYGQKKWGDVFITSYYTPTVMASKKKTAEFSQPVYGTPRDMVIIDYDKFQETFPKLQSEKEVFEQKSRGSVLRGRMIERKDQPSLIVPYYDRKEIDELNLLTEAQILAYVRPIDSFFMQIQGPGKLIFKDGSELAVGYAAQNGHPYVPIGKFLLDVIPIEKMSLQKIEQHMETLSEKDQQSIFNENPSYVFFQPIENNGVTYFGTPVVPGRTIATDYGFFPKGVLAFLKFPVPELDENNEVTSWTPSSRFVIDQDTGGAIRGPGRLDLYWGVGPEAKKYAGVMKARGELFYFLPKKEFIDQNRIQEKITQQ